MLVDGYVSAIEYVYPRSDSMRETTAEYLLWCDFRITSDVL